MNKAINQLIKNSDQAESIRKIVSKILFNSFLWENKVQFGEKTFPCEPEDTPAVNPLDKLPILLRLYKNIDFNIKPLSEHISSHEIIEEQKFVDFPLSKIYYKLETLKSNLKNFDVINDSEIENLEKELEERRRLLLEKKSEKPEVDYKQWLSDYEEYDEVRPKEVDFSLIESYGTPDPNSAISRVPCGGCGALLHCKDNSLPGYIPSEIFKNSSNLNSVKCQRCHFLATYNIALKVQVSNVDYTSLLEKIQTTQSLIVLIIDLLDFPCSIWPNFVQLVGSHKPLVVVGNKVDLLPQDSPDFLKHIKTVLYDVAIQCANFKPENIKSVKLISAKTGYGVENLITELHNIRHFKDDIYLIGCTNAGKSTLFNTLISSDLCKSQAADIMCRATTSVWPGTTLNLLKFPLLKANGWRMQLRNKRLRIEKKIQEASRIDFNKTFNETLTGHVGQTFNKIRDHKLKITNQTPFITDKLYKPPKMGINEKHADYRYGRWCYDTPGVLHNDQILNLLTTEELILTLPRERIVPRSYSMWPKTTLFIAGLARLDFIEGKHKIKFTVFCSNDLPITVSHLEDADEVYNNLLGSELFRVPIRSIERLKQWPRLEAHHEDFEVEGIREFMGVEKSCADIVLSNAGWISISCFPHSKATLRAWTPQHRGIYLRRSILPYAINLRGKRIEQTPAFYLKRHKPE